ncbi:hypothetical protein [Neorhodopirellula lusitana]|uniref:hypothetical protein n=1 Tax=Neorhodopirellula lusitana TaxID=445327 RepID=UPI0024B664EA|nr:hypothetical protein [Neorhodopirellula lusitana]
MKLSVESFVEEAIAEEIFVDEVDAAEPWANEPASVELGVPITSCFLNRDIIDKSA